MKILFISRSYPPIIGGLETHNHAIHVALNKKTDITSIINLRGKKALVFFLPWCTIKTLYLSSQHDTVLLGDGLLSLTGWIIKLFRPKTTIFCIAHGLDITYQNRFYQYFWIKTFLPKIDHFIAVSRATSEVLIDKNISHRKITIIPNGINPLKGLIKRDRTLIKPYLNGNTEGKTILLTVGRMVKRKGVYWFIDKVMPFLAEQFIFIIAGAGPDLKNIEDLITKKQLKDCVISLGFVSDTLKTTLYSNADLFIQPNIKVIGDLEGFGITVLEANLYGLPVVGSAIDGLQDSIIDGKNGWLIEPENATEFINKIKHISNPPENLKSAGKQANKFCLENFQWDKLADKYLDLLKNKF